MGSAKKSQSEKATSKASEKKSSSTKKVEAKKSEEEVVMSRKRGSRKMEHHKANLEPVTSPFRIHDTDDENRDFFSTIDFSKVFSGIRRHVWMILICAGLGSAAAVLAGYYFFSSYQSSVVLLYEEEKDQEITKAYTLNRLTIETISEMMSLENNFKAVKSILGLQDSVEDLKDKIQVTRPSRFSNLLRITCKTEDPNLSVDIVNTFANVVVKQSEDLNRKRLQAANDYFKDQMDLVRQKQNSFIHEIAEFRREHPHFELGSASSSLLQEAEVAEASYNQAETQYKAMLVEFENLKREAGKIPDHVPSLSRAAGASGAHPLQQRIMQTELALLEARTKYAEDNPKVKTLEASLEKLQNIVSAEGLDPKTGKVYVKNPLKERLNLELMRFQGKLRSAQKVKEELDQNRITAEKELETLPEEQMALAKLLQRKNSLGSQVKLLEEAMNTTDLLLSLGGGDLQPYQLADDSKSTAEIWKNFTTLLPFIGLSVGAVLGVFLAGLVEVFDRRICTPRQIDELYNIPCLTVVPKFSRFSTKTAEQETLFFVRRLVDRLSCLQQGKTVQSLALLSASNHEGKSCFTNYLARYYQNKESKKVLVVDFDYRDNEFMEINQKAPSTLDQYLKEKASFTDIVSKGVVHSIKTAFDPDMKELVKSDRMLDLWKKLQKEYDMILVEVPSIVEDNYGVNVASLTDEQVMIVGSSKVKRSFVNTTLQELYNYNMCPSGIVLNQVMPSYVSDLTIKAERKRSRKTMLNQAFAEEKKTKKKG